MTGKIRLISFISAIAIAVSLFGVICVSAASTMYNATTNYKSGKYYSNFRYVDLCGDGAQDTLAIALSQLGYHEGNDDTEFDGLSIDGNRDFVEYNVLYGKLDNDQGNGLSYGYYWCASFVNWCLRQAGVSKEASADAEVSCRRWLSSCKSAGIYSAKNGYLPKSGDLIFFKDKNSLATTTHMGLVLYSDGKNVYTIEGNTSNGSEFSSDGNYVALKSYPLTSTYIVGYASPAYDVVDDINRVDYSGKTFGAGKYITTEEIYVYSDDTYRKKIGKIEPFTVFSVESVDQDALFIDGGCVKAENVVEISAKNDIASISYLNSSGKILYPTEYAAIGDIVTLADFVPTRKGVKFLGWAIAGNDSLVSPSDMLTIKESIELIAIYSDTEMPPVNEERTEFIPIDVVEESTGIQTEAPAETMPSKDNQFENLGNTDINASADEISANSFFEKYGGIIAIVFVLFLIIVIILAMKRFVKKRGNSKVAKSKKKKKKKKSRSKKNAKKKSTKKTKSIKNKNNGR